MASTLSRHLITTRLWIGIALVLQSTALLAYYTKLLPSKSQWSTDTIIGGDSTPHQKNDCLLRVGNIRGIKLYSQNDEDGAVLQVLKCMGSHGKKEYFEFGAGTGVEVNTRILREIYGWHGHLLDGGHQNSTINLHKEFFSPSNIVSLLEKYDANKDLEVLSIDCDYDDFYIMREILLAEYRPCVLIIEYNSNLGDEWSISTIAKPVGKEAEIQWASNCYMGASARALIRLGSEFGYGPVWSNSVNLIFVNMGQAMKLGLSLPSPDSFPGPFSRAIHDDCDDMTWKVIDNVTISKAASKDISHLEFANAFSDIRLRTLTIDVPPTALRGYGNQLLADLAFEVHGDSQIKWRRFFEVEHVEQRG